MRAIFQRRVDFATPQDRYSLHQDTMGKCKMVASGRKCPPHFFWGYTNGRYECDSNCPQWSSAKIFSHTVAAVEYNQELRKFVKWYEKNNKSLNMMTLVTHNVSNAGRKETAEIPNTTQIPKWLSNIPNSTSLSQTVPPNIVYKWHHSFHLPVVWF